jgi:hypothetical protein
MKDTMKTRQIILATGILLATAGSVCAAVRSVNLNNATPTPPYTNWATAATKIQDAVNAAGDGDTVLVTNGTYMLSSQIAIAGGVVLRSVGGWTNTIVDGNQATRCITALILACLDAD